MSAPNVATRLSLLIDEARRYGTNRMTEPALGIWSATFGLADPHPQDVFAAIAATHRNIQRLQYQMKSASPELLLDCAAELDALTDAFSMRRLDDPWNNTRNILGDRVRLSLKACAAALDGRFDEHSLNKQQIRVADQLLSEFSSQLIAEALPKHIESFLTGSIQQLRTALRYMETLGTAEFVSLADSLVGDLGRALAPTSIELPIVRKVAKALGVTVASISAAVTMGLGVIEIDQQTVNLLPWGDQVSPEIVKCIIEVHDIASLPDAKPPTMDKSGE